MLFFDIGANVGMWALSNYNENTSIICVEASPTTFKRLVDNTKGKNIKCLNFAVTTSNNELIDFFEAEANTISTLDEEWLNNLKSRFYNHKYTKIQVRSVTIDSLVSQYGIPDILKVDVEGAENIVLKSLSTLVKIICFEWASEWNDKTFDALNYLESLGYQKFHIQNTDAYTYRPDAYNLNKENLFVLLKNTKPKVDWGMIWCKV
jgi:FkbM family methyltransferase